jgi:hypothetical protein
MGYMFAMGICCGCHQPFSFNPELVPSVRINGMKEPICQTCVERVNPVRQQNGLEPIRPLPRAYEPEEVA